MIYFDILSQVTTSWLKYQVRPQCNSYIMSNCSNNNKLILRPFLQDNPGVLAPEQSAILDIKWPLGGTAQPHS